jgi:hypothetical protein
MEGDCYLLVADVLGFSKLMRNLNPISQAPRVQQWVELATSTLSDHALDWYQIVSDSIFVGAEESEDGLRSLVRFGRDLLQTGIQSSLPVRGAISFGHVTWSDRIAFGEPVVDAYEFANNQEWIGISATNKGLPHAEALMRSADVLVCYPTPLKEGPVRFHAVVSWTIPPTQQLMTLMSAGGLATDREQMQWPWAEKFQNTVLFNIYLHSLPVAAKPNVFHGGLLPIQAIASQFDL